MNSLHRVTRALWIISATFLIAGCRGTKAGKCGSNYQCQEGAYCDLERYVCLNACEKPEVGCLEGHFCELSTHKCVTECPFECPAAPTNATALCQAACGYTCSPGYFDAGGKCDPCNVVDHCGKIGETCEVCAAPENSTVACTGGECVVTCADGHYDAGGSCPVCNVTEHCGDACENCVQKGQVCNDAGTTCEDGPRFVNVTDPTKPNEPMIKDTYTRLIWQGCTAGRMGTRCTLKTATRMNWFKAVGEYHEQYNSASESWCGDLVWGNKDDWRLPAQPSAEKTTGELASIIGECPPEGEREQGHVCIDNETFPNTSDGVFWSSSSASDSGYALGVDFDEGDVGSYTKYIGGNEIIAYVRCVR